MGMVEDMQRWRADVERARQQRAQGRVDARRRVAEIKEETAQLRATAREELRENAQLVLGMQQARVLEIGHRVQELRREARTMLDGFRVGLAEQGRSDAAARQAQVREVQLYIAALKEQVEALRTRYAQELEEERVVGRSRRREAVGQISRQVDELRSEAQAMLDGFRQELDELKAAWTGAPGTPSIASASKAIVDAGPVTRPVASPATVSAPEPRAVPAAPVAVPAAPVAVPAAVSTTRSRTRERAPAPEVRPVSRRGEPDDLERIIGIGPSTKQVLYEAGLFYFEDLASKEPESVKRLLGPLARFANVEHWIAQAKGLVEER
jgi:predicted flap endonuclease-1-like 5' DNA nuclease